MIENKIKEIQDYFIEKVRKGEYEFIERGTYTATIRIDNKYEFEMWVCNGMHNYDFYLNNPFYSITNGINITMKGHKSRGWSHMKAHLLKVDREKERQEKLKEFNRLKKELKIT
jgi:hypothetical protein